MYLQTFQVVLNIYQAWFHDGIDELEIHSRVCGLGMRKLSQIIKSNQATRLNTFQLSRTS